MEKTCPIYILGALLSEGSRVIFQLINEPVYKRPFALIKCSQSQCQLWNKKRNDCGLKQHTDFITRPELNSAIEKAIIQIENIKDCKKEEKTNPKSINEFPWTSDPE